MCGADRQTITIKFWGHNQRKSLILQGEFWGGFLEEVIFEVGFKECMGPDQGKCAPR